MSRRRLWPAWLGLGCGLLPAIVGAGDLPAGTAPSDPPCGVAANLVDNPAPLPRLRDAVQRRHRLAAVALGSSSTAGTAATGPNAAWPARLEAHLAQRLKGVEVAVVNAGQPRQTAAQMLERIDKDVLSRHPDLVVWEVGTAEAMRGIDPEAFEQVLLHGIDHLVKAGSEVLLMNMQFSRATSKVINFYPYLETVDAVAAMREVWVFNRHAIMQQWVEEGRFSFEDKTPAEQRQIADGVYDCLGQLLAEAIAGVVR